MTDHTERGEVLSREEAEAAVKSVFQLAYELAREDIRYNAYDPAEATAHSVDLTPCRVLIAYLSNRDDAALRAQLTRALVALRRAVNSNIIYPDAVSGDVDQSAIEWLEDVRANPPNGHEKGFARRALQDEPHTEEE